MARAPGAAPPGAAPAPAPRRRAPCSGCVSWYAEWFRTWATPLRLFILLCLTGSALWLDRGNATAQYIDVWAADGTNTFADKDQGRQGVREELAQTPVEAGVVNAAYYAGVVAGGAAAVYVVSARPHWNAFRVIGASLWLFMLGSIVCGFSVNFAMIMIFRFVVGLSAGPFCALAPALLKEAAPPHREGLWLGALLSTGPWGWCLGILVAGAVGQWQDWRWPFWANAAVMLPLALWWVLVPPVDLERRAAGDRRLATQRARFAAPPPPAAAKGAAAAARDDDSAAGGSDAGRAAGRRGAAERSAHPDDALGAGAPRRDARALARHPAALAALAGLAAFAALQASVGYYGPKMVSDMFGISLEDAQFWMWSIWASCGITGTLAGGLLLDWLASTRWDGWAGLMHVNIFRIERCCCVVRPVPGGPVQWPPRATHTAYTQPKGMATAAYAAALAAAVLVPAFGGLALLGRWAFFPVYVVGLAASFVVLAPAVAALLWAVPSDLRPFALTAAQAGMMVFGVVPWPAITAALDAAFGSWEAAGAVTAALTLLWGAAAFYWGWRKTRAGSGCPDYSGAPGGDELLPGSGTLSDSATDVETASEAGGSDKAHVRAAAGVTDSAAGSSPRGTPPRSPTGDARRAADTPMGRGALPPTPPTVQVASRDADPGV